MSFQKEIYKRYHKKSDREFYCRNASDSEIEKRRNWIKNKTIFFNGLGTILLKGMPLNEYDIINAKKLLDSHRIRPVNEPLNENDIFDAFREAYVSSNNTYKGSTSQNRSIPIGVESDFYLLVSNNKYKNPLGFAKYFIMDPHGTRRDLINTVYGMGPKTSSFMNLLIGGNDLITFDVHVLRQLCGIEELDLCERYSIGRYVEGKNSRWMSVYPESLYEYETLESHVKKYFEKFAEKEKLGLKKKDGKINGSLLTCLLWGEAVKFQEGITTDKLTSNIIESRKNKYI